jgi:hypothetical protein
MAQMVEPNSEVLSSTASAAKKKNTVLYNIGILYTYINNIS